ncbi:MAG: DUF5060 domain-containing protein [Bacteroidota bacterium]
MNRLFLLCFSFLCFSSTFAQTSAPKWQSISLDFEGPYLSETTSDNPFLDYRLEVSFRLNNRLMRVPGFFAADGKAAESSATEGNIWRVHFTPDEEGEWTYEVSFRKGKNIAVSDDAYEGEPVAELDGKKGSIRCTPPMPVSTDIRSKGRLLYDNGHYFRFQNGDYFLKGGANSPENFLACMDIDGTYGYDPQKQFVKSWAYHIKDWKSGDPLWQGRAGKGIIGALNYLASKKMNVVYALTLNIEGDARDVWPFLSHERRDFLRYDVSKLAQWDIVFSHAERKGIIMHLITQEKENELILDDGQTDVTRKLYYRELIARFAHHNNLIWNMGEENGHAPFWPQGQNDQQRFAMIRYLKDHDPYKHPIVIHTLPDQNERNEILGPLEKFDRLDGISLQVSNRYLVHRDVLELVERSQKSGRPWVVTMDEIGMWHTGTMADINNPRHDTLRQEVLWGALMAGAGGVEWYFGWIQPPHDLNAEDWRSRNNMWEQTAHALDFFHSLPFYEMQSADQLLDQSDAYCFRKAGEVYVVYLKKGRTVVLDLEEASGSFDLQWYDPYEGGALQSSDVRQVQGGQKCALGQPPSKPEQDWVILLRKKS